MSTKPWLEENSFEKGQAAIRRLQEDVEGFSMLAKLLKSLAGIDLPLNPKNLSLVASRVHKLMTTHNVQTYKEYEAFLRAGGRVAQDEFIFSLTTNTTQFYRENAHFEILAKRVPETVALVRSRQSRELRVWCAAASTGQEPYTILFTLLENMATFGDVTLKFLASDIDLNVLNTAVSGKYSDKEMDGVPAHVLERFFHKTTLPEGTTYRVKTEYRKMITFARVNLADHAYPFKHKFDIIFCRNVLIYFDKDTVQDVVRKFTDHLATGGLLFVGHSEAGCVRRADLRSIGNAVYEREPADEKLRKKAS